MEAHHVLVSELLGDPSRRYFSSGYRKVNLEIREIRAEVRSRQASRVSASLRLSYPGSWSMKLGEERRSPHMSTLDALLASVQLAEVLLVSSGVSAAERRWIWLQRAYIRAGTTAVENLEEVHAAGEMIVAGTPDNPLFSTTAGEFSYRFKVGEFHIELELIASFVRNLESSSLRFDKIDEILGPSEKRYFGEGFKSYEVEIGDGWVIDNTQIHIPIKRTGGGEYRDLGSSYVNRPTFVSCILGEAQVSQLILYSIDHIGRSKSEKLWMRSVELNARGPIGQVASEFEARASIIRTRLLTLGGKAWRVTDFFGEFGGITAKYNLAHQLPVQEG